jgi:hypothetical protein
MRKTLVALAITAGALLAGCGGHDNGAAPAPSFSESAAPESSQSASPVVDFRQDVSDVKAVKADEMAYPEGKTFNVWLTITNHGDAPADYTVTLAVYDSSKAEIGAMLIDTSNDYAAVKPGGVLKVSGDYGTDFVIPNGATVAVESVDRINHEGN